MGAQVYNQTIERLHYSPVPPIKNYKRLSPAKSLLNRTKRNLFGSVEPKAFMDYYKSQMQKASEEKRKKWNFNFNLEKPLDGPLQWEPVGTNRVPVVTLTQAAHVIPGTRRPAGLERSSSSTSSSSADILSSDELMDQRAERANRGSSVESLDGSLSSLSSPRPRRREFLKERKRRLSSTVAVEKISAKKVRMMMGASSSSSENGDGAAGGPQEASASTTN
ncbi:cyclin-dependent kinase inhibitor 1B-like [Anopheles arabiensis]|uniref:cyclin-dependent kinase inhibitor 1B-like n=1 Tax=Anopheles arabiensis TaxID=7173 RepID=UPI001AAD2C76|nr:cyclin-dependent kinase inhibitor 1B-like [Anopheles arabiensis]